jgi:hypothetical protein
MVNEICAALLAAGPACEKSLEALDAQYNLLAPARRLEREFRTGFEKTVGKKGFDTLTVFAGVGLDWQLRQRIYISIGGDF